MKTLPWTLKELARWAQWGCIEERIAELLRPQDLVWPQQKAEFAESWRLIDAALPEAQRHLLPQALAAALLTRGEDAPEWLRQKAFEWIDLGGLGVALAPDALQAAKWHLVPLALANESGAQLYWALVGLFPMGVLGCCWPSWWERTADREAVESVATALQLARERSGREYFFWPLLGRRDRLLILGGSSSLSVFLAAWTLHRGLCNDSIVATGGLGRSGEILPVAGLRQKAALAAKHGLKALLHPFGSKPTGAFGANLELIEVAELDEACLVLEEYSPGKNQQLLSDYRTLADTERLACSLHLLSPAVLKNRHGSTRYARQVRLICANPNLLTRAAQNLERTMDNPDVRVDLLELLLEPFRAETLRHSAVQSPAAAFLLAQLQLALANRRGRIETSRRWCELGKELAVKVAAHPEGIERQADFINRRLIHERHNRYDFRPELPPSILMMVRSLEQMAEVSRRHFGERAIPVLGRLYGTLAQHFGFCGPDYLHETLRYVELAQRAFGGGRLPEYRQDWCRQENYRCHALLDAGSHDEARSALSNYIGFDLAQGRASDYGALNAYQHAALARLCFETGQAPANYVHWCRGMVGRPPQQHPWQLWCTNVAPFLNDTGLSKAALETAVRICRRQGPTVWAMAFLPIEQLWHLRLAKDEWLATRTEETLVHLRGAAIHPAHFADLLQCGHWRDVLRKVSQARMKLYPFTYR